jgi:DNA-binding IclR family transcriptional regulator
MERFVQPAEQKTLASPAHLETDAPSSMVERAFQLLDLLTVADDGLALSELARALKMSKGSMYRLLKTLEHCGAVEQHEEHSYVLGPRIYKLATFVRGTGLRRLALPAMQRLVTHIGETIFLGRIEQESVHIIESVEAGGEHLYPHVSVPRRTRLPLLAGAIGPLVLADWPVEQRQTWLQKHVLPRYTEHSIIDADRFLKIIEEVARTGVCMDREEYLTGVNAVAVPITGPEKSLVALLCTLGFASHFDEEAMQHAGELLKAEAEIISRSLGA